MLTFLVNQKYNEVFWGVYFQLNLVLVVVILRSLIYCGVEYSGLLNVFSLLEIVSYPAFL